MACDGRSRFAFLRSVDIFRALTDRELSFVADVAEAVVMPTDQVIIREGDESDAMYILQASPPILTLPWPSRLSPALASSRRSPAFASSRRPATAS